MVSLDIIYIFSSSCEMEPSVLVKIAQVMAGKGKRNILDPVRTFYKDFSVLDRDINAGEGFPHAVRHFKDLASPYAGNIIQF